MWTCHNTAELTTRCIHCSTCLYSIQGQTRESRHFYVTELSLQDRTIIIHTHALPVVVTQGWNNTILTCVELLEFISSLSLKPLPGAVDALMHCNETSGIIFVFWQHLYVRDGLIMQSDDGTWTCYIWGPFWNPEHNGSTQRFKKIPPVKRGRGRWGEDMLVRLVERSRGVVLNWEEIERNSSNRKSV